MNRFTVAEPEAPAALLGATLVARRDGITWLARPDARDLDGAVAALPAHDGELALVAGGAGPVSAEAAARWADAVGRRARWALLYGAAAGPLAAALEQRAPTTTIVRCADVDDATRVAAALVEDGDLVLLAPGRPTEPGAPDPGRRFAALAGRGLGSGSAAEAA